MKRQWMMLIVSSVLLLLFASCKSTLGPALEREEARKNVPDLDLQTLRDETDGYHYPGLAWGLTLAEIQEKTHEAVTKISGVDENGNVVYKAEYLKVRIAGRENSDAQVGTTKDNACNLVMLIFSGEDLDPESLQQKLLFDTLSGQLTAAYGEPDEVLQHTDDISEGIKADVEEWIWTKVLSDGRLNKMVLSKAYMSYTSDPDYVSLTFSAE